MAAGITLGLLWWGDGTIRYGGLTILDWTLLTILAGCVQTICIRLVKIINVIQKEGPKLTAAE